MIAIVAAVARNGVIGKNNELPWHLPNDLKYFKEITNGNTVLMGKNTYDSIIARLGKPLPNRNTVVLSSTLTEHPTDVLVCSDITEALRVSNDIYIIGGAGVYKEALDRNIVDTMYLTEVQAKVDGDVLFPQFDKTHWREVNRERHTKDSLHEFNYDFVHYERAVS